ncbi:hypothetical protein [Demequina muriae]|uniref:Uncharacterized protein n=1 Tax=Demequina muriae TaxID=3051664 RepID=A0ABT8GHP9_9MICO|nr:hypothetical protein [Demequina sp. EGI L300058]MDN4480958.1 hypothetical protein [Demequina sp. EGI L300058]
MADNSTYYPDGAHAAPRRESALPEWLRLAGALDPVAPGAEGFASTALADDRDSAHASAGGRHRARRMAAVVVVLALCALVGVIAGTGAFVMAVALGAAIATAWWAAIAIRVHRR